IPWSPLHGGLLGGAIAKLAAGAASRTTEGRAQSDLEANRPAIEAYEKLCAELGHHPADVALAWLLAQPAVTAPIIGPRTLEQLGVAQLAAPRTALSIRWAEAPLKRLDELFPPVGQGGPGPEAWAW